MKMCLRAICCLIIHSWATLRVLLVNVIIIERLNMLMHTLNHIRVWACSSVWEMYVTYLRYVPLCLRAIRVA